MASFSSIGIGLGGSVDVNALIKASVGSGDKRAGAARPRRLRFGRYACCALFRRLFSYISASTRLRNSSAPGRCSQS